MNEHSNDMLVGHSVENDLKALHVIHPRVIDTCEWMGCIELN